MISKNTLCLWYNGTALDAATFYAKTFPDSAVKAVHHAPSDYPSGKQGDVLTVGSVLWAFPAWALTVARCSPTPRHSPSRWRPMIRPKPTVTGTPSSTTAAKPAPVAGVKTNGACRGRSHPRSDIGHHSPRSGSRQACIRGDDDYDQDRHRHHRGCCGRALIQPAATRPLVLASLCPQTVERAAVHVPWRQT